MTKLNNFSGLANWLDLKGFPQVDTSSGYKVVKGLDFEKEFKAGNIRFESDGIYIDSDKGEHQVYIFISEPYLTRYDSWPKFHVRECTTITRFIAEGKFNKRYHVSNSKTNDLTDIDTKEVYEDQELSLCGYCSKMINEEMYTTSDFAEIYVDSTSNVDVRVDNDGYVKDWRLISNKYRFDNGYRCEECDLSPKSTLHRYYWEVDHVDGNKLNNDPSNLRCLCVGCHSKKDAIHIRNYSQGANLKKLNTFNELYLK